MNKIILSLLTASNLLKCVALTFAVISVPLKSGQVKY